MASVRKNLLSFHIKTSKYSFLIVNWTLFKALGQLKLEKQKFALLYNISFFRSIVTRMQTMLSLSNILLIDLGCLNPTTSEQKIAFTVIACTQCARRVEAIPSWWWCICLRHQRSWGRLLECYSRGNLNGPSDFQRQWCEEKDETLFWYSSAGV